MLQLIPAMGTQRATQVSWVAEHGWPFRTLRRANRWHDGYACAPNIPGNATLHPRIMLQLRPASRGVALFAQCVWRCQRISAGLVLIDSGKSAGSPISTCPPRNLCRRGGARALPSVRSFGNHRLSTQAGRFGPPESRSQGLRQTLFGTTISTVRERRMTPPCSPSRSRRT
jgi:hypothetical protein